MIKICKVNEEYEIEDDLLLEAYRYIMHNSMYHDSDNAVNRCVHCEEEEHKDNCIVLKAERYINENIQTK